jgi:hypothetical protein
MNVNALAIANRTTYSILLDMPSKYDIYQISRYYMWVPKGLSLRCPKWAPTCATWTGSPMDLKLADLITSLAVISKASDQFICHHQCILFRSPSTSRDGHVDEG